LPCCVPPCHGRTRLIRLPGQSQKTSAPVRKFQNRIIPRCKSKAAAEVKYPQLFELLRQKRYQMAQEAHVPPYIIFSDKTLREMSTYLPQTEKEMLSINGVGTRKYEQYGEEFADVIREFMRDNQISK